MNTDKLETLIRLLYEVIESEAPQPIKRAAKSLYTLLLQNKYKRDTIDF
jgi:uncharacterized protein (UPF0147 family)